MPFSPWYFFEFDASHGNKYQVLLTSVRSQRRNLKAKLENVLHNCCYHCIKQASEINIIQIDRLFRKSLILDLKYPPIQ